SAAATATPVAPERPVAPHSTPGTGPAQPNQAAPVTDWRTAGPGRQDQTVAPFGASGGAGGGASSYAPPAAPEAPSRSPAAAPTLTTPATHQVSSPKDKLGALTTTAAQMAAAQAAERVSAPPSGLMAPGSVRSDSQRPRIASPFSRPGKKKKLRPSAARK